MNLEKVFISVLVFAFGVFVFEPFSMAVSNVSGSNPLKPLLSAAPLAFLVVLAIFPIYYLFSGRDD